MSAWSTLDERSRVCRALSTRLDALTAQAAAELQASFSAYRRLPLDELQPGVHADLANGLAGLAESRTPSPEELRSAAEAGSLRAEQGIPMETMLQGFQIVRRLVFAAMREIAAEEGVSPATLLDLASDTLGWVDVIMARAAEAHRAYDVLIAQQHEAGRLMLLRDMVLGDANPAEVWPRVDRSALSADRPMLAFRLRPLRDLSWQEGERVLRESFGSAPYLSGMLGGDLAGVAHVVPTLSTTAIVGGVGPAVELFQVAQSYVQASRALDTAYAFRLEGLHTLPSLGLLPAVVFEDEVGDELVRHYFGPFIGRDDEVATSLEAYLASGLVVTEAAAVLHLHPNTLRYRLRRFSEATAADLASVEELARIWWALKRRRLVINRGSPPVAWTSQ